MSFFRKDKSQNQFHHKVTAHADENQVKPVFLCFQNRIRCTKLMDAIIQ